MMAKVERLRPPCPLGACDGSGWLFDEDEVARPCECRERMIARARVRGVRSVLPPKYQGVGLDRPPVSDMARDPRSKVVVDQVRAYVDHLDLNLGEGRGLWLRGDVGTGKTTLAMLVSKSAIEAGRTVAIYSLPRLLARIRRTYDADPGEDSYLAFFRRLTSVDLLHLDDLGAEKRSDWVLEQLYAIVDERYVTGRSMVVTTNLDQEKLEEQIGVRTVSRLVEMCEELPLFGDDHRGPLAAGLTLPY
jgi:DNA replication protein DnaC